MPQPKTRPDSPVPSLQRPCDRSLKSKVILDLEEERQRHAQDTAEGDDVTYMLEKERERLTQQVIKVEGLGAAFA